MKEDVEHLKKSLDIVEKDLAQTRRVLGTLIAYLQRELGEINAVKLLDDLSQ